MCCVCVCDLSRYVWVLCACFAVDRKGEFMIWRVTSEKIKQKCSIPTRDLGKITCKASVTKSKRKHVMLYCFFSHHKVDNGLGHVLHTPDILFYSLLDVIIISVRFTIWLFSSNAICLTNKEMGVTLPSRVLVNQMNLVHRSK